MKKRKILKGAAIFAALLLTAGILCVINVFTGYPVDYFVVNHAAQRYMEETYGDTDYVAGKPERMLKLGGFLVEVTSPSDPELHFSIQFHCDGTVANDGGAQPDPAELLNREYDERCGEIFANENFPAPALCDGYFHKALTGSGQGEPGVLPEPLDAASLDADSTLDLSALAAEYGTLYLTVESEETTAEMAAQSLLAIRQIMESNGLPFCSVDLWINSPEENENRMPKSTFRILNFGWEEIREEGLVERAAAAAEATEAYYRGE